MRASLIVVGAVAASATFFPIPALGQDIVKESLATFPPGTIRIEYSRPAKLRTLSNYASLRQRYVGPRLRALQESFAKLGVGENDVDEVILDWRPGASTMDLEGIVAGRFTAKVIAARASASGVSATEIGGLPGYCLDVGGTATCLVVLRDSLGLFGLQEALSAMLDVREGRAPALSTDSKFARLLGEAETQAPIWGVAVGEAVPDWFRAWLPGQGGLQLDWSKAFQSVEALVYSVDTTDRVRLGAKLECADDQSAESTRQVFEGLRMFQQMAWQNTNPGKPNPFEGVEIARDGRRVSLRMTTTYDDLHAFTPAGGGL